MLWHAAEMIYWFLHKIHVPFRLLSQEQRSNTGLLLCLKSVKYGFGHRYLMRSVFVILWACTRCDLGIPRTHFHTSTRQQQKKTPHSFGIEFGFSHHFHCTSICRWLLCATYVVEKFIVMWLSRRNEKWHLNGARCEKSTVEKSPCRRRYMHLIINYEIFAGQNSKTFVGRKDSKRNQEQWPKSESENAPNERVR